MKPARERPSIWYLIVTLLAMYYLSCVSSAVFSMLNLSRAPDQGFNQTLTIRITAVFLGLLMAFAWCFLIRDLIRQILRFFPREKP